jgi:hypothetical protein
MIILERAAEESERKSERVSSAWRKKQKEARVGNGVVTRMTPAWICSVDGKFELIPEAVLVIQNIFQMKLDGVGIAAIASKLNATAVWAPPIRRKSQEQTSWEPSYIKKILRSTATIGFYQPKKGRKPTGDAVAGYFPAAITPSVFHAVQRQLDATEWQKVVTGKDGKKRTIRIPKNGGFRGQARNLVPFVCRCAYCGGPMAFVEKRKNSRKGAWLICDWGRRGVRTQQGKAVCTASHRIHYCELEDTVLDNCRHLQASQVLPHPDEQAKICQSLRQRLAGYDWELADITHKQDNLAERLLDDIDVQTKAALGRKGQELAERSVNLTKSKAADVQALQNAERDSESLARWKEDLQGIRAALAAGDAEVRLRMRAHLRELISKIEVFSVGWKKRFNSVTDGPDTQDVETIAEGAFNVWDEANPGERPPPEFAEFVEDLVHRRMSREGRFLRVTFKSDMRVDLVPPGSLASGFSLDAKNRNREDPWRFVEPDVLALFEQWKVKHQGKRSR